MSRPTIMSRPAKVGAMVLGMAALAITGSGEAATQQAEQGGGAGSVRTPDGERLYRQVGCAQCHGGVGQGGSAGPALAGRKFSFAFYDAQVRNPVDAMPPYTRKVLSEQELRAIYEYVMAMEP